MIRRHVVLIGSAGTGTAFGAVCALRRTWSQDLDLIAIDVNQRRLVTSALLADHFEQVPFSISSDFPHRLLELLKFYNVDTYLPLLPEEIAIASRLREEGLISANTIVVAPPMKSSIACEDKFALFQLLGKSGIPHPRTALANDPFIADEYFIKPRIGSGSHGVKLVSAHNLEEIVAPNSNAWIVQDQCMHPEVTVDVFYDPITEFSRVICRERLEVKAGVSVKARLFEDMGLESIAISLARTLSISGSFCFQVMQGSSGWVVTDVNPRPGAATSMCSLTGNDFFSATFAYHWREDFKRFFQPLDGHQFITRQYTDFFMGRNE